jgi:hypothetical protein
MHVQIGWSELKLSVPSVDSNPCHLATLVVVVDSWC